MKSYKYEKRLREQQEEQKKKVARQRREAYLKQFFGKRLEIGAMITCNWKGEERVGDPARGPGYWRVTGKIKKYKLAGLVTDITDRSITVKWAHKPDFFLWGTDFIRLYELHRYTDLSDWRVQ